MTDYIPPAILATVGGLSLSAIAAALITFGEFREHKKNILHLVANNFQQLKDDIDAHEERDNVRHQELMARIEKSEGNILDVFKRK